MSKKILSIALAVVMLISVFAFSASAANTTVTTTFPTEGQGGFRVVTDAYVGMPAGEEVTVKVYWVHPVGTDYSTHLQNMGNVILAYNGDAFKYNTTSTTTTGYDGRTWGSAYAKYVKEAANVNVSSTYSNNIISKLTGDDANKGWTKAMLVQMSVNTANTTTYAGFAVDPDCEIFSLSFTTNRTIVASDSFGLPANQSKFVTTNGSKNTTYTDANTIVSEGYCPALVVANSDTTTAKMRPGTAAGTVDLGIFGTVNGLSFNPGKTPVYHGDGSLAGHTAANLANVGVQARVNGVVSAAEGTCIYEIADGFNYAAAITGIDAAGLGAQIEVRTYITDVNGNTYFSNWMFIDATTVHENAVGNGMTGIA